MRHKSLIQETERFNIAHREWLDDCQERLRQIQAELDAINAEQAEIIRITSNTTSNTGNSSNTKTGGNIASGKVGDEYPRQLIEL